MPVYLACVTQSDDMLSQLSPELTANNYMLTCLLRLLVIFKGIFGRLCTAAVGSAKRALILSIVGVSGSGVRVPPAAIYGTARAVNSNSLSHRFAPVLTPGHPSTLRLPPRNAP